MTQNQIIAESGWKFVASVSGGGQEIFGELTRHGGMSSTLLEGIVPYSIKAYQKLIGGNVDQIVSPAAARAAAMACYKRAREYTSGSDFDDDRVFGFASTGSVVKPGGERTGREHRVCMAIQDVSRTIGINIVLKHARTREEEEKVVSDCIRQCLIWGCRRFGDVKAVLHEDDHMRVESTIALPNEVSLVHSGIPKTSNFVSRGIFSSSCNPLHAAHLAMISDASKRIGFPVDIELCIVNADKPPLDYLTIKERRTATKTMTIGNAAVNEVILTNKPLFFDKVDIFPGATFIVGADTFDRILDPKYYANGYSSIDAGLAKMVSTKSSFLVYPRKGYDMKTQVIPYKFLSSVATVVSPYEGYEISDISSTSIRQAIINANS